MNSSRTATSHGCRLSMLLWKIVPQCGHLSLPFFNRTSFFISTRPYLHLETVCPVAPVHGASQFFDRNALDKTSGNARLYTQWNTLRVLDSSPRRTIHIPSLSVPFITPHDLKRTDVNAECRPVLRVSPKPKRPLAPFPCDIRVAAFQACGGRLFLYRLHVDCCHFVQLHSACTQSMKRSR